MTSIGKPLVAATAAILLGAAMASAGAGPPAEEALAMCAEASALDAEARTALLGRGLALAETALARDAADARAHLAAFCNLGRLTQADGIGLSTLPTVRRLARTIATAHRLAPDDPDVLAARGAFLLELPRMLGGDPARGEALLRRAVTLAPENAEAAARLARVLEERGRRADAMALHARR